MDCIAPAGFAHTHARNTPPRTGVPGRWWATVATLRGDRVALLAYTDEIRVFVPPGRGRPAFLKVVDALYNLAPEPTEPATPPVPLVLAPPLPESPPVPDSPPLPPAGLLAGAPQLARRTPRMQRPASLPAWFPLPIALGPVMNAAFRMG